MPAIDRLPAGSQTSRMPRKPDNESSPVADFERSLDALEQLVEKMEHGEMSLEESLAMHHYNKFFFHGTGHWLGLDVHDAGAYRVQGAPRKLQPGMAFTVEPGIYIAPDKGEITLTLLEYDQDEWNQRRILEGRAAAMEKEAEAREKAEKITHKVPPEFLGIGIRIEDDVVLTEDGSENLTTSVPKSVEEIEALCAEAPTLPGGDTIRT